MNLERQDDKFHTPEYESLRDMAVCNWEDFCRLIGEDCMTAAIICRLRAQGKSMMQISNKFNLTKRKVQLRSEGCICDVTINNKKM